MSRGEPGKHALHMLQTVLNMLQTVNYMLQAVLNMLHPPTPKMATLPPHRVLHGNTLQQGRPSTSSIECLFNERRLHE